MATPIVFLRMKRKAYSKQMGLAGYRNTMPTLAGLWIAVWVNLLENKQRQVQKQMRGSSLRSE
jgi:hypothetical protein